MRATEPGPATEQPRAATSTATLSAVAGPNQCVKFGHAAPVTRAPALTEMGRMTLLSNAMTSEQPRRSVAPASTVTSMVQDWPHWK
ncbi:MAG: hypothetical protein IPI48_09625 [bacterium]|nr:hypothetical protein [bacterium]